MVKETIVEELKVASITNPSQLAGAIVKSIQKGAECSLVTIGAGPINQAVKAIAIANRLLGSSGTSLSCKPCFVTLDLSGETREGQEAKTEITAIKFKIIVDN